MTTVDFAFEAYSSSDVEVLLLYLLYFLWFCFSLFFDDFCRVCLKPCRNCSDVEISSSLAVVLAVFVWILLIFLVIVFLFLTHLLLVCCCVCHLLDEIIVFFCRVGHFHYLICSPSSCLTPLAFIFIVSYLLFLLLFTADIFFGIRSARPDVLSRYLI